MKFSVLWQLSWELVLLLGDLKHAEALVLLQKLILGPDLLPEAVKLLLLLLRTHVDARHGAYELPHLLELCFESIQVLVEIWAVLVHAMGSKGWGVEGSQLAGAAHLYNGFL